MRDTTPCQFSVNIETGSNFTVFWSNAGSVSHSIGWLSSGDIGTGTSYPAAYNLINYIAGDSGYFSWTQDGTPDYETVYLLQSSDDTEYATYTTLDVYTPEANFYSLPQNYYYKFYVSSHYPGPTRVDSVNSSAEYVFGI